MRLQKLQHPQPTTLQKPSTHPQNDKARQCVQITRFLSCPCLCHACFHPTNYDGQLTQKQVSATLNLICNTLIIQLYIYVAFHPRGSQRTSKTSRQQLFDLNY